MALEYEKLNVEQEGMVVATINHSSANSID